MSTHYSDDIPGLIYAHLSVHKMCTLIYYFTTLKFIWQENVCKNNVIFRTFFGTLRTVFAGCIFCDFIIVDKLNFCVLKF